jgi:hypothetical protein
MESKIVVLWNSISGGFEGATAMGVTGAQPTIATTRR